MKHNLPNRRKAMMEIIDSTDMRKPEREQLKHNVACEFILEEEELHQLKLDEAPYKEHYDGKDMLAIHHFIETFILGTKP